MHTLKYSKKIINYYNILKYIHFFFCTLSSTLKQCP